MVKYTNNDILVAGAAAVKDSSFFIDPILNGYHCIDPKIEGLIPKVQFGKGKCWTCFAIENGPDLKCLRVWHNYKTENLRLECIEHIQRVSNLFKQSGVDYVKKYIYVDQALRLKNGNVLPAILMDWVSGYSLIDYVKINHKKSETIRQLTENFMCMCQYHKNNGMAHGDLSSENIRVQRDDKICLIDYDTFYSVKFGKFIPEYTNGTKGYQHPERLNSNTKRYMSERIDYFSQLIIYFSLLLIAFDPQLYNPKNEYLIFSINDLESHENLIKSQTYKKISAIKNQEIQLYLKELVRAIGGPLSAVRSLVDVKKEIDAKLHPARPVEHVHPLPSIPTTRNYQVTCVKCGKTIQGTSEVKFCPYCGRQLFYKGKSNSQPNNTVANTKPQDSPQQPKNIFKRIFLGINKLWDKAMGNIFTAFLACFSLGPIVTIPSMFIGGAANSVYYAKSGDKYFYGQEGVQQNYVQAVQEYTQIYPLITFNSKRTNNSTYNLATCYEYGLGTNKDSIQAFDRYLKAAKKGHIMAMNKVAQCYAIGYGTIQSTEESSKWFEKSLRKGSAEDLLEVGWQYEIGNRLIQNYAQAMKCYTTAAEKGLVAAQMKLGDCYLIGTCGAQKNTTDAAKWYQMAANQGDGEATEILQLLSNKPTSRDIHRWYHTGCNYYHGNNGVKIDYAEAIKWHRKAALMGHADAQNYLGVCYDNGRGLNEDDVEAVKWYRKAAAQGNKYAQNNLGLCYAYGRGLNEDDIEAVKWYRKAAEQGHADAQNNLGNRLYNGQGIIKNYAEAAKWYRKSAENGNQNAQYNLGWCYQYGQGVTKNLTEAKKWYQKAADKGHESAKKKLVELNQ